MTFCLSAAAVKSRYVFTARQCPPGYATKSVMTLKFAS